MQGNFRKDCADILSQRLSKGQISRREFATGLAMLMGAGTLGLSSRVEAASGQLVYVNWGGDAIDAMMEAFGKRFMEETGIKVVYDGAGPTEGAIKAQAETGSPTWDACDCEPFSANTLGKQGMMTPIDYNIVDRSKMREGFGWEYAASTYFYSYVIAYDATRFDTPPTSMADFFDVEKFPGKRTMYKWGAGMWEAALLADGVAPADLYPLDLDRAHAKIKGFLDNVSVFWGGGSESQSVMLNGEASMGLLWNTRAKLLKQDTDGEIDFIWNDGILAPGSTGVLANNPAGAEAAMRYIRVSQEAEGQATLFRLMGNGPSNAEADALLTAEENALNPSAPANAAVQHPLSMDWYGENYGPALDAYLGIVSA